MLHEHRLDGAFMRQLEHFLEGRTCLLGIGSRWWHDDGAGSHIAKVLEPCEALDAIDAGFVPENYLETVARTNPDTILLVDAADFGGKPGEPRLLRPQFLSASGLSTHAGSLQMLAGYLRARTDAPVAVLAIQPQDTSAGEGLSPPVAHTVLALEEILPEMCRGIH